MRKIDPKLAAWLPRLRPMQRKVLAMRWGESLKAPAALVTLAEAGEILHLSRERIRQIEAEAQEKLRKLSMEPANRGLSSPVTKCIWSVRARNALLRSNIRTLGDVAAMTQHDLAAMRNVGPITQAEIIDKIRSLGMPARLIDEPPHEYKGCAECGRVNALQRIIDRLKERT